MAIPPEIEKAINRRPLRLVIVDDHIFMRDLLVRELTRQEGRYNVASAVGTAAQAIAACEEHKPDLLILDINLPDRNGIDALADLKRVAPAMRILLCTGFPTDDRIADLAGTGAHGFVEKTNSWDEFLLAIERVSKGEYYFCCHNPEIVGNSERAQQSRPASNGSPLTTREKEIIRLVAQGLTSKEIATRLYISATTVETHRTNLMAKVGARNVAELVAYAFRKRLVGPSSKK